MTTRARLAALMDEHNLTRQDIALICHVSEWTVQSWLADPAWKNARGCPAGYIDLIEYKMRDNDHV
jgi:hypothetical protein